jgi:hypothetical protein
MYRYLKYEKINKKTKKVLKTKRVLKTYNKRRNCWVLIGTSTFQIN